ncbi:hypothetical protein L198_06442 [Cryptococcus wingfieldii CBS 7118]|uniref:F-box domain-containing protein n=1 Tax=Cryptococcus wingfieldii CBS 7118 TaxID=1295528 RepID=A0A1E3IMK9_9TREE|nr:hypothetical protein L198_06442 [Cryptococcus wingfieldii CBS 7118]ODN89748.1 hypothetical protein L198_06442 [Cryptococcus wingfieldii CBS 7118]
MALTTLDPLPSEVRQLIFVYLQTTTDKPTLATLARVSRKLYAQSIPRLYKRVRLNGSNAEAFFGRLIAEGRDGVEREVTAHKAHILHYVSQLARLPNGIPSSHFIPSPIARKLCQIWRTTHIRFEDGPAAMFLLEAVTSLQHLRGQLRANMDGLSGAHKERALSGVSKTLLDDYGDASASVVLGEPLARCIIFFPDFWKGVFNLLKGNAMGPFDSICLRLPPNCPNAGATQYCKDMFLSSRWHGNVAKQLCIHNANPLDHMSGKAGKNLHISLLPEGSPGMISHESSIGAFMDHFIAGVDHLYQIPHNFHFYNSTFTDEDRVSHAGVNFWDRLESEWEGKGSGWDSRIVTLTISGPEKKMPCPVCLEIY